MGVINGRMLFSPLAEVTEGSSCGLRMGSDIVIGRLDRGKTRPRGGRWRVSHFRFIVRSDSGGSRA